MLLDHLKGNYDQERATGFALVASACERSNFIRQRLAAVAEELRQAAATAGASSENLLKLASKLEQNSKPGDLA